MIFQSGFIAGKGFYQCTSWWTKYIKPGPDSSPFFAMISSENSRVCCNRNLDFLMQDFGFDT